MFLKVLFAGQVDQKFLNIRIIAQNIKLNFDKIDEIKACRNEK